MSDTENNMQELADLSQSWEFLMASLTRDDFGFDDAETLQKAIEYIIYAYSGRLTIVAAVGILELIKSDLLNPQDAKT